MSPSTEASPKQQRIGSGPAGPDKTGRPRIGPRSVKVIAFLVWAGACRPEHNDAVVAAGSAGTSVVPAPSAIPSAEALPTVIGAAHVLVAYKGAQQAGTNVVRTRESARARAEEALTKLRSGAEFGKIARDYSDDASKQADGKIGNLERAVMPQAFSEIAFRLRIGEISELVETPRGFHIILRYR